MSLRINLNSAALNAHRQLGATDSALGASIEKLSSGFRINRAADDPAGLAISEGLRAQIAGIGQAISNSQDAVNMIKTAEGALTEVHSLLRTMRTLAVHASNRGALDDTAISADQAQIESSISALNRIGTNTAFGNKKLLDGTGGMSAVITDYANIGSISLASDTTAVAGNLAVNVTTAATQATLTGSVVYALDGTSLATNGTISVTVTVDGVAQTFQQDFTTSDTIQDVVDAINAADIGVTADHANAAGITLTSVGYGSNVNIQMTDSSGTTVDDGSNSYDAGGNAAATVTADAGGTNVNIAVTGQGKVLTSAAGDTIVLTDAGNAVANHGNIAIVQGEAMSFQVGSNANETMSVSISEVSAAVLGNATVGYVSAIDVTTAQGAEDALGIIDEAISQISTMRSELGAAQKSLEANINSLGIAKENISASESSVRDTDMASEMVTFTRNQILLQAGTAMLTQANSAPQALLALLR